VYHRVQFWDRCFFIIFVNDIDEGIVSRLLKFADDTKMAAVVSSEEGIEKLQSDLKKLYQWVCDWQMLFNVNKCKVIHFGQSNGDGRCVYTLGSNVVKVGKEERVLLYKSLKPTSQCIEAVKSANKTLGMISRTFMFKDKNTMLR